MRKGKKNANQGKKTMERLLKCFCAPRTCAVFLSKRFFDLHWNYFTMLFLYVIAIHSVTFLSSLTVGNDFTYIGRTEKHVSRSHEPRSLIYSQLFVIDAPSVTAAPAVSDAASSSEETKTDANSEDSAEAAAAAAASASSSSSSSSSTPDAVFRFVVMPIGNEPAEQPLDLSYPLHLGAATVNVTPLLANAEEGSVIQQSIPLQSASNSPAGLIGEAALDVCLASVGKVCAPGLEEKLWGLMLFVLSVIFYCFFCLFFLIK